MSRVAEVIHRFWEGRRSQVYASFHPRESRRTVGQVLVELRGLPLVRLRRTKITTHDNRPALKYETVDLPDEDRVYFGIQSPADAEKEDCRTIIDVLRDTGLRIQVVD